MSFFTTVASICGTVYGISYWKIIRTFRLRLWLKLVLAVAVGALLVMPYAGVTLERRGHFDIAGPLASVGFVALVMTVWFCGLVVAAELWNVLVRLIGWAVRVRRAGDGAASSGKKTSHRALRPPRRTVMVLAVIAAVITAAGVINAYTIRQKDIVIPVPHLPDGRSELVVAQVTDLHLGLYERGGSRMRQVIDLLERVKPDVILFTGDMIDSPLEHVNPYAEAFTHLEAPLGKYAVLGNHEMSRMADSDTAFSGVVDWYRRAGFRLLRQESVRPAEGLLVAGVDDPPRERFLPRHFNELLALADARPDDLVLFLVHTPPRDGEIHWAGQTMVQFAGHTHGGQIWPWHYLAKRHLPLLQGLYILSPGRYVYTNPGAGTWAPPVRLGANPEVAVFRFQKAR